jgi:hypothetical protein
MATPEQLTQKTADAAAAGSAFLAGTAWIAEIEPYMTVAATFVAVLAGATAAWFHIEKALAMRAERKRRARDDARRGGGGSNTEAETQVK